MSLAKEDARKLIDIYIRAWTTQDPDLILTIFTPAATYHERVLEQPIRGHDGIREYWQTKVVKEQANISAELLSLYLDGTTAIAEWEARFDDVVKGHRLRGAPARRGHRHARRPTILERCRPRGPRRRVPALRLIGLDGAASTSRRLRPNRGAPAPSTAGAASFTGRLSA